MFLVALFLIALNYKKLKWTSVMEQINEMLYSNANEWTSATLNNKNTESNKSKSYVIPFA